MKEIKLNYFLCKITQKNIKAFLGVCVCLFEYFILKFGHMTL